MTLLHVITARAPGGASPGMLIASVAVASVACSRDPRVGRIRTEPSIHHDQRR
jgi:hypothetical protein